MGPSTTHGPRSARCPATTRPTTVATITTIAASTAGTTAGATTITVGGGATGTIAGIRPRPRYCRSVAAGVRMGVTDTGSLMAGRAAKERRVERVASWS